MVICQHLTYSTAQGFVNVGVQSGSVAVGHSYAVSAGEGVFPSYGRSQAVCSQNPVNLLVLGFGKLFYHLSITEKAVSPFVRVLPIFIDRTSDSFVE